LKNCLRSGSFFSCQHRLHLGEALRLREDVGVRHRDDVDGPFEVGAADDELAQLLDHFLVAQVLRIEPVQDQHLLLQAGVHPGVDRREVRRVRLDQRHRGAHRHVGAAAFGDPLARRGDDALGLLRQPLEQREQRAARAR
jgi:hypothetical protein